VAKAVNEIMVFANDQDRLRAIQVVLDEVGIELRVLRGFRAGCMLPAGAVQGWTEYEGGPKLIMHGMTPTRALSARIGRLTVSGGC
jgi:hypothetical protein